MEKNGEDIAIIGIGCNFPGGEGIDNFWKVLLQGRNCVVDIPPNRFDTTFWYNSDGNKAGKMITKRASLIEGFNEFDHNLFDIRQIEANSMDPQHKLLLECTYKVFENAGIPMEEISGSKTGVFIGLMNRDYEGISNNIAKNITHYNGTGSAMSIAANRISFAFNLTGPSLAIDTACSSSLVALHYAAQAIKQGDCEMAVCGGASCIIEPRINVALSKAQMISPDGMSKPFSIKANGYGRGEGCGVLLLKPLAKAQKDHDHIWGVIVCSAINQDGRAVTPITRPSQKQQEELLRSIYLRNVDPSQIQYMEAHGTGTPAGDPTEAASISNVIAQSRHSDFPPLTMGSVKGNIGHTESAAGAAGLIKVLLMMHHGKIVSSLHYSEENSSINAKALNLHIPTAVKNWEENGEKEKMAGINSFGFGGTNAHVVIRQLKRESVPNSVQKPLEIFVLSAASQNSVRMMIKDTSNQIRESEDLILQNLAYTSACRRSHKNYRYRKAFKASSLEHLQQQLRSAADTEVAQIKSDVNVIFVFCGNGVLYQGMCKQLLQIEPRFRTQIEEIEKILQQYTDINLIHLIENDCDNLTKPDIAQPLLFVIQVAVVNLLKFWGIQPDIIIGHSVGEVAAVYCAGILSLQDAVKVLYHRSALQSTVTGGKMLVVSNLPVSKVSDKLDSYSGRLCIAAFNSPSSCTVSGDDNAIDKLRTDLHSSFGDKNVFLHILDVPAAYHSHLMEPILNEVEERIGKLQKHETKIKVISTVTGQLVSGNDCVTGTYWSRNIENPVLFEQAVRTAVAEVKNAVFIEIGPRRALQRYIKEIVGNETQVFPAMQPERDYETMLSVLSGVFEMGYNPNWQNIFREHKGVPTLCPCYKFDHTQLNINFEDFRQGNENASSVTHPLLSSSNKDGKEYNYNLTLTTAPYLLEHKNNEVPILPGSMYVELALASALASIKPKVPLGFCQMNITFLNPCIVQPNSTELKVKINSKDKITEFTVMAATVSYAKGEVCQNMECIVEENIISLEHVLQRANESIKAEVIYETIASLGFQYASVFRNLREVFYSHELKEAITYIKVPDELVMQMHEYCIHPVILDYYMQMCAVLAMQMSNLRPGFPTSIGSLIVCQPMQQEMMLYVRTYKNTAEYFEVSGAFTDTKGIVIAELKNVRITFLGQDNSTEFNNFSFENTWEEIDNLAKDSPSAPKALVFADNVGVAKVLQRHLHRQSSYIPYQDPSTLMDREVAQILRQHNVTDLTYFDEVLFLWGMKNLTGHNSEVVVNHISGCCEVYRQILQLVQGGKSSKSVRIVTFRTSEKAVDQITAGFALWGMTRSCLLELQEVSLQLIDIGSTSEMDITALAHTISLPHNYPEVMIQFGKIHISRVRRAANISSNGIHNMAPYSGCGDIIFQTMNPYKVVDFHAKPQERRLNEPTNQTVHVKIDAMCIHSSDYFPVSVSAVKFGQTLYWNTTNTQGHELIAVDFSGTITSVSNDVKSCNVGDHVVVCYPVAAHSTVSLPASVCFKSSNIPLLKQTPCVSYFTIAWEILCNILPQVKHHKYLAIHSSAPESCFRKVLSLAATSVGWQVQVQSELNDFPQAFLSSDALLFLPPIKTSLIKKIVNNCSAKHVIVLVDNSQVFEISQNMLGYEKDNVQIHFLQVANILKTWYLKKSADSVYKWMKSLRLKSKQHDFPRINFHSLMSDMDECRKESYLTSEAVSVVDLNANALNSKISEIPVYNCQKQLFSRDAAYIVTGGLSGLGLQTVHFIAEHGGGVVIVLSRRSPCTEKKEEFKNIWNQFGTTVVSVPCDISKQSNVELAINQFCYSFPKIPIKGVFHSAVVLHDALLQSLNRSLFDKVLAPKIAGVLNLHNTTKSFQLDYFVCYSSIASFIGNPAQANYSAANSFLDFFVHYRRNHGLAGQSINWGALNLGLLLNKVDIQRFLESNGIMILEISEIKKCLEQTLELNNPQQAICKFNFSTLYHNVVSQNPAIRARIGSLVEHENNKAHISPKHVLSTNSPMIPEQYIIALLSEVSDADPTKFTKETYLSSFGLDSMLSMTVQNRIYLEININLPLVTFLDPNTTVGTVVSLLEKQNPVQPQVSETNLLQYQSLTAESDENTVF
ncbi:highly reducing polyketide synthase PKS6-like [Amblyraja radiata]|uniref:highly reducing polyketide synthase PKS6-like n=1 Tax=Amblyraja radiata TaxID=386614 RepID=UPI001402705C|nr:highly reducing polyketide synthase PKS6-like [Amblyraja radiata]XP_032872027.1 highly reducing polyketide synthase PKS6-like [Amblyraja radiata]